MSEAIYDHPLGIAAAAAATGFRRHQPSERRAEDEPHGEAGPAPEFQAPSPAGDHPAPPLPDAPPAEAFTTAVLASQLLPPLSPPIVHTADEWSPPPSDLHLTDREV